MALPAPSTVIIGIGNPMRRDDGVGPAAIACLREMNHRGVVEAELITLDGEPARLMEAWRNRRRAIVIDAARSGIEAGSIHRAEVDVDPLPAWAAGSSSHSAGLAEAIALSRAIERLPESLIVYGVEPDDLSFGEGLSPKVQASVAEVVNRIIEENQRR